MNRIDGMPDNITSVFLFSLSGTKLALPSVTIVFSTDVTIVTIVFSVAADSSV